MKIILIVIIPLSSIKMKFRNQFHNLVSNNNDINNPISPNEIHLNFNNNYITTFKCDKCSQWKEN